MTMTIPEKTAAPDFGAEVAFEQVDYPRILYVCEHCQENAPEMCGRSRDDLYVTPSGQWLCDECRDEEGVPISDCVSPPALYPASTVAQQQYVDANEARIDAEARLAEALKALEPFALVAEHDIGEDETDSDAFRPMPKPFNHAPQITVGHIRAARRALTVVKEYLTARRPAEQAADYFGELVARARQSATKASAKFPQPNYVTLKIAEEAGEVVRGAVHYAEGRMEWSEVEGEIVQLIAMLIRFVTEGDQINGITPPARAALKAAMEAEG